MELARDTYAERSHDPQHQHLPDSPESQSHAPVAKKADADQASGTAALERMAGAKTGAALPPQPVAMKSGDTGMITADLTVTIDGKPVKVPQGTVAVVKEVKGADIACTLWGTLGGKLAHVPVASLRVEPALTHNEAAGHEKEPEQAVYQDYPSVLWNGGPKATDVAQGHVGDCYLMAAMGAVAAANPGAIRKAFSPQTPNQKSYTVTLFTRSKSGTLAPKDVTVDTELPTRLNDVQRHSPIYALMGQDLSSHQVPIWPALLEKAYGTLIGGGYEALDEGGEPAQAMEALTGVESAPVQSIPKKGADVLTRFREFQKAGKAVVCTTVGERTAKAQTGFKGAGDGPYRANLKSDQGEAAEIVKGTLGIHSKTGKPAAVKDDENGKLHGTDLAKGNVNYDEGDVELDFKSGRGPATAEELLADYHWEGNLDSHLTVYANHSYIFESVTADGKLVFKNPWGDSHPLPLTPADFQRMFDGINLNDVVKKPGA